jgi:rhamnose utilization protein RhaD (predicted bifunctional aldolase and dehydrogenase)/NAD(P)-dependent dehydrogenase (short-subunit alcohol dehydrogenase family)
MKSLWNVKDAAACRSDELKLRVYTSRLLGRDPSLVLHGGGNTSVKVRAEDFYGDPQDVLYIKGSGWDLASIEAPGFAAVKLDVLKRMAQMPALTDIDMVREQRAAMLDPNAPNPSVEAVLHAIIPFKFVDHSHADAVVAITNTPMGARHIQRIYGSSVLIVPYVMPGFILARQVFQMTKNLDWKKCRGIVLLNHGLFTFADEAKKSYEQHIRLVNQAEAYIKKHRISIAKGKPGPLDLLKLAKIRQAVGLAQHEPVVAHLKDDAQSVGFANLPNISALATRGTLTPDHVLRTKPRPAIIKNGPGDVAKYAKDYQLYFKRNSKSGLKCLDLAPRWAVWPGQGLVTFGRSYPDALVTSDVLDHTVTAIQWATALGGWKVLSEKDIFQMEYWELEQAKLGKSAKALPLQGKIAVVTGAANGIGKATAQALITQGAHVAGLDVRPEISSQFNSSGSIGLRCDVTKPADIASAVAAVVRRFGGLDILVCNAGIFPPSMDVAQMDSEVWDRSMAINLTGQQRMISAAVKFLKVGFDPTIIIVGSKNVPAPGPGAAAYSAAKAGLTQLARVAALELGGEGIRVNVLHPNQVFDTGIWTDEVLTKRAKHYGMSIEEYKTNNLLKTQITSHDVALLICTMAGPVFSKTTGAQIPIDGGNDRVI